MPELAFVLDTELEPVLVFEPDIGLDTVPELALELDIELAPDIALGKCSSHLTVPKLRHHLSHAQHRG